MSWVLAIDFGTSNTTAAHTVDGVPQVLEVDGGRYLPSAVIADPEAGLVTGREARRQVSLYPERAERTPKRALASGDLVVLGQRAYPAAEVAGAVLARMYGEAVRFHGSTPPDLVILTHPARWGEQVTGRLREAATLAGITGAAPLQLLPEPEAAAWFYAPRDGQVVAVFDLGGGTLDTAVLKAAGGGFALQGQPGGDAHLGGEDFDELLLDWVAARARERDEELWEELESGAGRRASRDKARLRIAVTDAKEALSTDMKAGVTVGDFEDEFQVTRDDLEKLIAGTVGRAVTELRRTLAASGVSVASLAGLYLTGGSSRTPLIGSRLWEEFGIQPQLRDDPKTVVVEGALRAHAEAAAAKAKAARKAAESEAAAKAAQEAAKRAAEEKAARDAAKREAARRAAIEEIDRKAREESERRAREEAARKAREEAERNPAQKASTTLATERRTWQLSQIGGQTSEKTFRLSSPSHPRSYDITVHLAEFIKVDGVTVVKSHIQGGKKFVHPSPGRAYSSGYLTSAIGNPVTITVHGLFGVKSVTLKIGEQEVTWRR